MTRRRPKRVPRQRQRVQPYSRMSLKCDPEVLTGLGVNLKKKGNHWISIFFKSGHLPCSAQESGGPKRLGGGSWEDFEASPGLFSGPRRAFLWASQGSGVCWGPLGGSGGLSEVSGGLLLPLLGPSWACSGAVWGCPGRLLGSPGAFLARLGAVLGGSWAVLARSWGPLRPSWSVGSTEW